MRPGTDRLKQATKAALDRAVGSTIVGATAKETDRSYYLALSELWGRYADGRQSAPDHDLSPAELRVSSQNGEDGVIVEMLRRAGVTDEPWFVEFGAEHGAEANCVFLADILGWHGLFIEGDTRWFNRLEAKYALNPRVTTLHRFVTSSSIEMLLAETGVPLEFDVLSIDVDNQDWWIWRAITRYRPRIVIVEYNPGVPRDKPLAVPEGYDAQAGHSTYFGAGIEAFRVLGEAKGYRLVHTDLTGANAFFVRRDQPGQWPDSPPLRGYNYRLRAASHAGSPRDGELLDITRYLKA